MRCNWKHSVFTEVWERSGGVSELSSAPIYERTNVNFAHILAKADNKYPLFIYYPKNIIVLTFKEHTLLDQGTAQQRQDYTEIYLCDWNWIYELREVLKTEYEQLVRGATTLPKLIREYRRNEFPPIL